MTHTRSKKRQPEYELVEYSDLPFLVPHQIERNVKNMLITLVCSLCGDEYTETYARQYPDRLAAQLNCPNCYTHTYRLVQCVPNTVHYRSTAMERGSFSDDILQECFECGESEGLHPFAFSNGMQVQLCTSHQKRYFKEQYKLSTRDLDKHHTSQEEFNGNPLW